MTHYCQLCRARPFIYSLTVAVAPPGGTGRAPPAWICLYRLRPLIPFIFPVSVLASLFLSLPVTHRSLFLPFFSRTRLTCFARLFGRCPRHECLGRFPKSRHLSLKNSGDFGEKLRLLLLFLLAFFISPQGGIGGAFSSVPRFYPIRETRPRKQQNNTHAITTPPKNNPACSHTVCRNCACTQTRRPGNAACTQKEVQTIHSCLLSLCMSICLD
jgi:hypothetical protein